MARRPSLATQADLKKMIRAAQDTGLRVVGIEWRADGVKVATDASLAPGAPASAEDLDRELNEFEARHGAR
ncbi:MAG: hypothetical protein AB7O44_29265 [Hyphomicrobiaceae bacterium]